MFEIDTPLNQVSRHPFEHASVNHYIKYAGGIFSGMPSPDWVYQCPRCKHLQTGRDFMDLAGVNSSPLSAAQQCIGNYLPMMKCTWSASKAQGPVVIRRQDSNIWVFQFFDGV